MLTSYENKKNDIVFLIDAYNRSPFYKETVGHIFDYFKETQDRVALISAGEEA